MIAFLFTLGISITLLVYDSRKKKLARLLSQQAYDQIESSEHNFEDGGSVPDLPPSVAASAYAATYA